MEIIECMSILELKAYYDLIRYRIDDCLIKLKMNLTQDENKRINEQRLNYNRILDKLVDEINKRISYL